MPYLATILVCNVVDWALTRDALALGIASEANPVAGLMLGAGDVAGLAIKVGLVAACCLGLWLLRSRTLALRAAQWCAGAYVAVVLYQALARAVVL
ncbi:MAG TPA: hypothetical protein DCQ64_26605 [Candidatus Rokubacteria bacterium]|nr:hypothetical protein [Candidatus Rokubacteria bacterium]